MSAHPIEGAITALREVAADFSLIDCEVRSIFNMGLIARYNPEELPRLQKEDNKMRLLVDKTRGIK